MAAQSYATKGDARRAGWVSLATAQATFQAAGITSTTHEGRSFGYGLWLVIDGERREVPTATVELTEEINKLRKPGAYATMVRTEVIDELIAALDEEGE